MPFLTAADGTRLFYEVVGDGPPLILQTGGAGAGSMWRDAGYVDGLAKDHRCVLFDHRGHGRSDQPATMEAHAMARYIADLVSLIDHLDLRQAAFWGYSQGADIGLSAAAIHPERFTAVVSSGVIGPNTSTPEENREQASELRRDGWGDVVADSGWAPSPWFMRQFEATNPEMLALWYEAYGDWDTWSLLPKIEAPVLMFVGELEDPDRSTDAAGQRIRDARVIRLAGLDHIGAYERSDLVLPAAREFLGRSIG
jgi:pimeloyl-ACP methyl ester carboxylesterase